jgi:uncharacterized iron-regulated membrane protein
MLEPSLRKWHRWLGITIVLFVVVQTLTGLILNLEDFFEVPAVSKWASLLHRGLGDYGTAYRTLLALGLLGMACTGFSVYVKIWQRRRKK